MKLTLCTLFLLCFGLFAQSGPTPTYTRASPDCDKEYTGAATGATATFDNSDKQCGYWQMLVDVSDASPVISATFQHAPWNAGRTGAGTFATFGGTTEYGANPCVSVNCLGIFIGHYPFVRVNVTSLTGTYRIRIIGWRAVPKSVAGTVRPQGVIVTGSTFTTTGCSATTPVGGPTAGTIVSGTTGACSIVVTMGGGLAAPTGWACAPSNRTTANLIRQSASSTTTATLTGVTVADDVISFSCVGY